MKLQGRNLVFDMQEDDVHELMRELTAQIYGKITSKLASSSTGKSRPVIRRP